MACLLDSDRLGCTDIVEPAFIASKNHVAEFGSEDQDTGL